MKRRINSILALTGLIFLVPVCLAKGKTKTETKVEPNPMTLLELVKVEADEKITAVSLLFPPGTNAEEIVHDLTDHGLFFQINLSKINTPNPGQFVSGQGPYVSKIAIFQAKDATTAVRIFTKEKTSLIRHALKVDAIDNRILLSIDHKAIASKKAELAKEAISGTEEGNQKISTAAKAKTGKQPNGLHSQLEEGTYKAAIFSAILFAAFLVFTVLKPKIRNRARGNKNVPEELATFKKLGSTTLAPKQKIIVMEISGEKILLATTPQGIQFLTKLENNSPKASFVSHLQREMIAPENPRIEAAPTKPQTIELERPRGLPDSAKRVLQAIREKKSSPTQAQEETRIEKDNLQQAESPHASEKSKKSFKSKLAVRIDDSGITDLHGSSALNEGNTQSVEDITAMIRRKLKDLPKII